MTTWERLTNRSLSFSERLQVALNLWETLDKEESRGKRVCLTQWTCDTLIAIYKRTTGPTSNTLSTSNEDNLIVSDDLTAGDDQRYCYWEFLMKCLFSLQLNGSSQWFIFNQSFIKTLSSAVTREFKSESGNIIFQCLEQFLLWKPIPAVLMSYDIMLSLTVNVLRTVVQVPANNISQIAPTLIKLLDHIAYLQSIHGNPKKVYTSTCQQILEPLMCLGYSLSLYENYQNVTEILLSIRNIIANLFSRDHLVEYMSLLTLESTASSSSQITMVTANYTRHLFETLETISQLPHPSIMVSSLPFLFNILVEKNSFEKILGNDYIFLFLAKLFQLMGVRVAMVTPSKKKKNKSKVEEEKKNNLSVFDDWNKVDSKLTSFMTELSQSSLIGATGDSLMLDVIQQCLIIVEYNGVYQITGDNEGRWLYMLQHLTSLILTDLNINFDALLTQLALYFSTLCTCFGCLEVMLKLNHEILLPILSSLWSLLLYLPTQQLISDEILNSISKFSDRLVTLYSKLRKLPSLVNQILTAIRQFTDSQRELQLRQIFLPSTEKIFHTVLRSLPYGQCIELLKIVIHQLKEIYLPLLDKLPWERSPKKKRRKEAAPSHNSNKESIILATHIVVELTAGIISSVSLDTIFGRRKQCHVLLTELINDVCIPYMELADNLVSVRSVSLHLQLVVCQLFYTLNAVLPDEELLENNWRSTVGLVWSHDLEHPQPSCWKEAVIDHPQLDYLLRYISILELRFNEENSDQLLNYLLVSPSLNCCGNWNGQVLGINYSNVHTAIWTLILNQLPYLSCHMTHSSWEIVADVLIKSLSSDDGNYPGLYSVTMETLMSVGYKEMKPLHLALLNASFDHIASLWPKKCSSKMKECLSDQSPSSIFLPDLSELSSVDEKSTPRLKKFLLHLSICLKIVGSLPFQSCDDHMTKAVVGVLHWTVASIITDFSFSVKSDTTVEGLVIFAKLLNEMTHLRRQKKRKRKEKREELQWTKVIDWLLKIGVTQDMSDTKLHSALLVAMETTLQWCQTIKEPYTINEMYDNEFCIHWQLMASHILSQYSSDCLLKTQDDMYCSHVSLGMPQLLTWVQPLPVVRGIVSSQGCVPSYQQLQSLMLSLCQNELFLPFLKTVGNSKHFTLKTISEYALIRKWVEKGEESMLSMYRAMSCIWAGLQCILEMSDTSDITSIVEHLVAMVTSDKVEKIDSRHLCFCLCWQVILTISLSHDKKIELRRWLTKVVTQCVFFVTMVTSKSSQADQLVIIHALQVLQYLVLLPHQYGLDVRTVHLTFHGLGSLPESLLQENFKIFQTGLQLLISLAQSHSQTFSKSPSPMIGAILKFLRAIVTLAQQQMTAATFHMEMNKSITLMTKLLELLVKQEWFKKYAVHCMVQYIISSQQAPLNPEIKRSILPGVLILLKVLSSQDVTLIKSSVDEDARTSFQNMIDEYNKFYRFKGKI